MEIEKNSFPFPYAEPYFKENYQKYPEGFVVAERKEGEIIGYVALQVNNNEGKIISLAISSDFRKRKIGTKLVNFSIHHFKEKGLKQIFLHIREKNNTGVSFYKKFRFKILKIIEHYYPDGENAFLMKKELGG